MTDKLPVWKDEYHKMGVTPLELYMRQNGLCYLTHTVDADGSVTVQCTDGKDTVDTSRMLNPTIECVQCMMRYTTAIIEYETKKDK